jgi:hypothetical protein
MDLFLTPFPAAPRLSVPFKAAILAIVNVGIKEGR